MNLIKVGRPLCRGKRDLSISSFTMSLRLLTPEQIDALTSLSAPEMRKKLYAVRENVLSKLPPAPVDEPAKIEDSSFKGPDSEIPIRIFTPDGEYNADKSKLEPRFGVINCRSRNWSVPSCRLLPRWGLGTWRLGFARWYLSVHVRLNRCSGHCHRLSPVARSKVPRRN